MTAIIIIETIVFVTIVSFAVCAAKDYFKAPAPKKRQQVIINPIEEFEWVEPELKPEPEPEPCWTPALEPELEPEPLPAPQNPVAILCDWRERALFQSKDWNNEMKEKFQTACIHYGYKPSKEQIKLYYQLDRYAI